MKPFRVELAPSAAKTFARLSPEVRSRIRDALVKLAIEASRPGRVPGMAVKTIQGSADSFHRLRVGDFRIMYDVLNEDRVVLVLGLVHRADLERWLRNR